MPSSGGVFPDRGGGGRPSDGQGHPGSTEESAHVESVAEAEERLRRSQAQDARPRMNIQQIHSWVDLEIEQALRRGDFDNLPGAGKPLRNLDQNDPDWWVKGLIEREKLDLSSALPTVLALRQERRGFPESLAGIADEVAVRERLEDYNARVIEDRRKPVVGPNPPAIAGRVDVDEMVVRWRELRADRERRVVEVPSETVHHDATPELSGAADLGESPRQKAWVRALALTLVVCLVAMLVWTAL
ncbi:DUF1992 domain-containing protein [Ornithinimicrobium cavernae]|uniref:DnaJ family domain-containing protein n=1 Tax=Ornithinimicrobium cavernae TaxID=2666047 RepID=UPI001F3CD284|nr:DUF1992 domain-containing protein [Ornithinimicrobium cavernae]